MSNSLNEYEINESENEIEGERETVAEAEHDSNNGYNEFDGEFLMMIDD